MQKHIIALLALALFATACTKSRPPALPEDAQENTFAISEVEIESATVKTDDQKLAKSLGNSSKATAEKGTVAVADTDVPERLKFMFRGLEISGLAQKNYPITLSVDKQFVTAYKVVSNASELSVIEKSLAQTKEQINLQKQLQKAKTQAESKSLMTRLQALQSPKAGASSAVMLVPIFKYKITAYGVLQRTKNEYSEETSVLRLKPTDWSEATHIQIATKSADRLNVGLEPAATGELDRTFMASSLHNKLMKASTLADEYQIPLNLAKDANVLTIVDTDALHVYEIGSRDKLNLTDVQLEKLKSRIANSNVLRCSPSILKAVPAEAQKDCVMVLRYDVPLTYVKPELPRVDLEGNRDSKLQFKTVRAGESVGLVQIAQDVQAKKVESGGLLDPRTTLRVSDIKDKEFFFKRTLEDAPETLPFEPGFAGNLTIVKFELLENRIVVRKADKIVDFKRGSNDFSQEELMSFPVKYFKRDLRDSSGARYTRAQLVPATRQDAEYVDIDWTGNKLSGDASPYETLQASCVRSVADTTVSDVDMKLDKGILNFSYNYSVGLSNECINTYSQSDYNGTASYQNTAKLKERVSFKLNDGTTDKSFVGQIPFVVQNQLGYGVWTIGKLKPTERGVLGHEGEEESIPVVQDFRNGKVLQYTVTGLENRQNEIDPEMRKMYLETIKEVIDAWDFAYQQVFKGTQFDRKGGHYVTFQIAGENGVEAHVGDLDKNIIHFENKTNIFSGGLGVSQVGFNPRSGIVVADSLIIFAGNLQSYIAGGQVALKRLMEWEDTKKAAQEKALKEGNKAEITKAAVGASPESFKKVSDLRKSFKNLKSILAQARKNARAGLATAKQDAATLVEQRQALGGNKSFAYGTNDNDAGAWLQKATRRILKNPTMSSKTMEGVIASEMLAADDLKPRLTVENRAELENMVRKAKVATMVATRMKSSPGCQLEAGDVLPRDFAKKSYRDALKQMLYFDLAHEMGHSQGLTHNFIGSFDKPNFSNEDGTESKRNYSSIMDYFANGYFNWDGIGTYDIHALRASHFNLLEVKKELQGNEKIASTLVDGKYISIDNLKKKFASAGWNNFTNAQSTKILRTYRYCTDIHVGIEPNCQRFDVGTSAVEIVQNLMDEYNMNYINRFYSWDKTFFGDAAAANAYGSQFRVMMQMRQFLDEFFFAAVGNQTTADVQDLAMATMKSYVFFNQVIRIPDANSIFLSPDRLVSVPYTYNELDKDGKETGKTVNDVAVVEKRLLNNSLRREGRYETIGIEQDKVMAMNMITLKGFPEEKYASRDLEFSYLDFEKYIMKLPLDKSLYASTVTEMLTNNLRPTYTYKTQMLEPLPGLSAEVSSLMRAYAGISSVLALESTTLRDQDNFANMFKVGTSIGQSPDDRISLGQLGASPNSKVRVNFWPLDNAVAANSIFSAAAKKFAYIQRTPTLQPLLEKLIKAQFAGEISKTSKDAVMDAKLAADIDSARAELAKTLAAENAKGAIVTDAEVKENPELALDSQVTKLVAYNEVILRAAIAIVKAPDMAGQIVQQILPDSKDLARELPLFALDQKVLASVMAGIGQEKAKDKATADLAELGNATSELVDSMALDFSYGLIMKNIEFLSKLTSMTNPEYSR